MMAKTIVFSNRKGGTGKTTLSFNIASYLANKKYRTLLIDLDSQAHSTIHAGLNVFKLKYTIYEVLIEFIKNKKVNKDVIIKTSKLDLIPSNENIAALEIELSNFNNQNSILKDFLIEFEKDYDFIIIDTPPSLGLITINALVASDYLIIPVKLDFFSLVGIANMMNIYYKINSMYAPNLKLLGIIPVNLNSRAKISKEVFKEIENTFGKDKLFPFLKQDIKFVEASSHGLPIFKYSPKSSGSEAIRKISKELLRRISNLEK